MAAAMGLALACQLGAAPKKAATPKLDMAAVEASMKKSDCFTCHAAKRKVVGPAFADVAKKYKVDKKAVDTLVVKVKNGGSGNWGAVPMAGHPDLKDEDLRLMVRWVLAQK